ncbi:MAG: trypsin-like peptidase domain-containing protein [Saprospiraceae bacterium]
MKTYFQWTISGVTGGFIVLFGLHFFGNQASSTEKNEPKSVYTNYHISPNVVDLSGDFVESAKKSTSCVVHIYAEQTAELVMKNRNTQRRKDPFMDFFGFEDFFGGENFYTPKNGSGSGVIYSPDGYVITNNHVVGFADKFTVTDSEGNKYSAQKIGTDESTDLAILKVAGAKNWTGIKMGDSDKVNVGEWVLAVGNPFGYLTSTVTAGIVSAKGRSLGIIDNKKAVEEFIQTDAAINPGNSGGALVNLQGELIGINTAIATPTGVFAGYSFAIPSKIVSKVIKNIIERGGDITPINLGVGGYDLSDDLISEYNLKLKSNKGFYVEDVERMSAAQMGGLLPGDVIIQINNTPINNYDDIEKTMKYSRLGDKVSIKVNRNGKEVNLSVQ